MSRTSIELTWEGGENAFFLGIRELRALQTKCDAGPAWIASRLESGQWMVDDILETIRLGLEGAGMEKPEAKKLVKRYVEDEPLYKSVKLAFAILAASLMVEEDDPVGEFGQPEANGESFHNPSPAPEESSDFQ